MGTVQRLDAAQHLASCRCQRAPPACGVLGKWGLYQQQHIPAVNRTPFARLVQRGGGVGRARVGALVGVHQPAATRVIGFCREIRCGQKVARRGGGGARARAARTAAAGAALAAGIKAASAGQGAPARCTAGKGVVLQMRTKGWDVGTALNAHPLQQQQQRHGGEVVPRRNRSRSKRQQQQQQQQAAAPHLSL